MKKTFLFDKSDKNTLDFFSSVKDSISANSDELIQNTHLHPHGIKELLESKQIRVAKLILLLLHAMDKGTIDDRLNALHSLRDEVLLCSENPMPINTARILLCMMKELVRSEDETEQLELLHDFSMLIRARSCTVRKYLKKYNLLEMPEAWNQIAFDYHVHDSYTEGRKTPTHLIMDAWIKGIKQLNVIYYGYAPKEAVRELLSAAAYMSIKVKVGIENIVLFNGKPVNFIWIPEDLPDVEHWCAFLDRSDVIAFNKKAMSAADNQKTAPTRIKYNSPMDLIKRINKLSSNYGITLNLSGLTDTDVLELLFECKGKISNIEIFNTKNFYAQEESCAAKIKKIICCINEKNTAKLKRIIKKMLNKLKETQAPYQSLKSDFAAKNQTKENKSEAAAQTNAQEKMQSGKVMYHIKYLNKILSHLSDFFLFYEYKTLYDRWGSDSVGKASEEHNGMGFALLETLPVGAQIQVLKNKERRLLPVHIQTLYRENFRPAEDRRLFFIPHFRPRLKKISGEWITEQNCVKGENNLVALGEYDAAYEKQKSNSYVKKRKGLSYTWKYMNTGVKNKIKILSGFIPAFLSFYLTKDWWVLKFLGAVIWFAITGVRNIIQAVVSGDSRKRSPLLHWTSYVDWSRIADSLMYTGWSVPLLDYFVTTWLLKEKYNITVATAPFLTYTVISLVNGVYISSHNILRGLPKSDVIANFFRSIISIPFALALSSMLGVILTAAGLDAADIIQRWAAIISKLVSDTIGGVIEGLSTRKKNIDLRNADYGKKLYQMQKTCTRLEFMFPKKNLVKLFRSPETLVKTVKDEDSMLFKSMMYDSLDFFYFWLFQPHARTVLISVLKKMSRRGRNLFLNFQNILNCRKAVIGLLTDKNTGMSFRRVLKIYLMYGNSYLTALTRLSEGKKWDDFAEEIDEEYDIEPDYAP
ncbi:hypothetical protein HRQ91_09475 [Treponema parvum]|uniref:Uncharacterized protein n=1 Tax=Treponema parvum TaxID=138851 RepID=A0A975IF67_9SPIR|nr:hypothetical protein [Treponema parvum]QTQ14671.1 hypothetical protein HRQ91_09475 [Treponema parvum]